MTSIVQVKCPGCNTPIYTKVVDNAIYCERCGTLHTRDGGASKVDYLVGELSGTGTGEKVYYPFWMLGVSFHIDDIENKGDWSNLFGLLGSGQNEEGNILMFVPAFEMEPGPFKDLAMGLMDDPPASRHGTLDPRIRRKQCVVKAGRAAAMADFLFVTGVADKPGTLQRLDYRLAVRSQKLLYLLGNDGLENDGQDESAGW